MTPAVLNLHNHTPFSDGAYTIDELCEAHLDLAGCKVDGIGISDHLFCTPSSREITNDREFERIFVPETRSYVAEVRAARQRWAGKLQVFCGAEINYPKNRGMLDRIRTMLDGVDYVIFEYVDWAGLTHLANQSRRWPCPIGLAHTAVHSQYPNTSLDQVVRTLANARIFYEVSSKFLPLDGHEAWLRTLPGHRVAVTVGTDTHDDLRVLRDIPTLYDTVRRFGLESKLLTPAARMEPAMSA
ncbi:MAG: hypothetical protein HRU75_12285 [Planctomycetia bacterium]|nr:MAG: hypothetical protein HRU75_12285 [Planctomycetia bacterium]